MPSFLHSIRRRLADRIAPTSDAPHSRRDFFRQAAGAGAAALGAGLLLPDDAWAGIEERAAHFGITPGTVVDAQGRPVDARGPEPFIGEIMIFAGSFAPRMFATCDGQVLPIAQNSALFSILGITYGGDGRTTFGLPDLRGRVAIHAGHGPSLSDYRAGQKGGVESVTLNPTQIPSHQHATQTPVAVVPGSGFGALGNSGASTPIASYTNETTTVSGTTGNMGGSQSHENRPPYLTVNFCIATQGIFPSRG